MNTIEDLIDSYSPKTIDETKLRLKEMLQQIILIGLSKANFFKCASFYGGTALRIFYSLNRYSEDLDFTLNQKNDEFSLEPFTKKIKEVAGGYGIQLNIETKPKKVLTPIESAFAKLNAYQTFIALKSDGNLTRLLHKDEIIKIKFEVDRNPALGFACDSKWLDVPEFANIKVLNIESLFAGKIHAILCRNHKNNVKGRDYYDFLFYIKKRIKPNLIYLKNKLIDSGTIKEEAPFDMGLLKEMLKERFDCVNFDQVKQDAERFVINNEDLSYFSKDLFVDLLNRLN